MKTRKSKLIFIAIFAVIALLLSACQINFITDIKSDGSGAYIQEIGFQGDEASMAGLSSAGDDFCTSQNEDTPPGTTVRQETRNEDETWCIYETPFESLEGLKTIYGTTDTGINNISLADGKMTYDITLDFSGESSDMPSGAAMYWIVKMPGSLVETNATQQDGNTLTWNLQVGQVNNIRAVSNVGGLNLGGNTLWYVLGGVAFLCLCCVVPLAVAGGIFFYTRRKKNAAAPETPAEIPAS